MEKLTLQWDMPHTLTFVRSLLPNRLIATLEIVKKANQTMTIEFEGYTFEDIEHAWTAQGRAWNELVVENTVKKFTALRVIWLPHGRCLQWHVLHIQDKPFDAFACTTLTKELWETTF